MRQISEGLFAVYERDQDGKEFIARMWHTCKEYKDREEARVELMPVEGDDGNIKLQCPYCGFSPDIQPVF